MNACVHGGYHGLAVLLASSHTAASHNKTPWMPHAPNVRRNKVAFSVGPFKGGNQLAVLDRHANQQLPASDVQLSHPRPAVVDAEPQRSRLLQLKQVQAAGQGGEMQLWKIECLLSSQAHRFPCSGELRLQVQAAEPTW